MVVEQKKLSVKEFEAQLEAGSDRLLELFDGEVIEKLPTEVHGFIVAKIISVLFLFVEQHKLGYLVTETRHRLPDDQHNSLLPDISFIADQERELVSHGPIPQMPDLAVEVKPPDDTYKQMRAKAAYYTANGTKLVWLVYPEKQIVEVYQPGKADIQILVTSDTLSGGDVLPGFELKVSEIFPKQEK